MSIKPILFNTEMVQAILEGRKTVTRRVVKMKGNPAWTGYLPDGLVLYGGNNIPAAKSPYHPGDILWVRETFFRDECSLFCAGWDDPDECPFNRVGKYCYGYRTQYGDDTGEIKWHPSIHMPKSAARLFLRVKSVRVERLQTMDVINCVREGATWHEYPCAWTVMAKPAFIELWNSTIKPADLPRCGWDANPWVWVVEFERCEKPEEWEP